MLDRKVKYENKFIKKSIRFSNEEFKLIEEQREKTNLDFTNYAKKAIMNKRVIAKVEEDFNRALIYELNKIGNNISSLISNKLFDLITFNLLSFKLI